MTLRAEHQFLLTYGTHGPDSIRNELTNMCTAVVNDVINLSHSEASAITLRDDGLLRVLPSDLGINLINDSVGEIDIEAIESWMVDLDLTRFCIGAGITIWAGIMLGAARNFIGLRKRFKLLATCDFSAHRSQRTTIDETRRDGDLEDETLPNLWLNGALHLAEHMATRAMELPTLYRPWPTDTYDMLGFFIEDVRRRVTSGIRYPDLYLSDVAAGLVSRTTNDRASHDRLPIAKSNACGVSNSSLGATIDVDLCNQPTITYEMRSGGSSEINAGFQTSSVESHIAMRRACAVWWRVQEVRCTRRLGVRRNRELLTNRHFKKTVVTVTTASYSIPT